MRAATLEDHRNPDYAWGLTVVDPPVHTWKRKIAFEMFKPGAAAPTGACRAAIVDDLIDRFADRGECEFVSEFTLPLTASVILTLFGLPLDHLDRALAWSRYEGFGTRWAPRGISRRRATRSSTCGAFLRERVRGAARDPGRRRALALPPAHLDERGGLDLGRT